MSVWAANHSERVMTLGGNRLIDGFASMPDSIGLHVNRAYSAWLIICLDSLR